MIFKRRAFILGGIVAAASGIFGFRYYTSLDQQIVRLIATEFGDRIGGAQDAKLFAEDLAAYIRSNGRTEIVPDAVILAFLQTTNVVRALETGYDLVFLSFVGPIVSPCQNPLSAGWL